LAKIVEPGVRVRAQHLYQQLDSLEPIRLEARRGDLFNLLNIRQVLYLA
jgi:hypothetical protein